jgi:16S rRNA (cytidine1402-2'-O)-methyltransferase
MDQESGSLYVVATPIGNLSDITYRAVQTLKDVDLIAAEDTRHVKLLLNHYGITANIIPLHQHNEAQIAVTLIAKMRSGISLALVSDAGTPLISDPGLPLVQKALEAGIKVVPIPGACALIAALSVSGLPTTRFTFEGFLPRTPSARRAFFQEKLTDPHTWLFYESNHRIQATLEDMAAVLQADRSVAIARELTKLHETLVRAPLVEIAKIVENDAYMSKGEFVVLVAGAPSALLQNRLTPEQEQLLHLLLKECSVKTTAAIASEITGISKKILYQTALKLSKPNS